MRTFECDTVVPGCEGVVSGATDDEVLAAAAQHAAEVHGITEPTPELVAAIRGGIHDA